MIPSEAIDAMMISGLMVYSLPSKWRYRMLTTKNPMVANTKTTSIMTHFLSCPVQRSDFSA
jgi:hypothetical protein